MVRIRRYRASDAEGVSEIIRATMQISNAADYPMERLQPLITYFSPEKVEQLQQERITLVAERDGQLIGTAALEAEELVTFFVRPEHQGTRWATHPRPGISDQHNIIVTKYLKLYVRK